MKKTILLLLLLFITAYYANAQREYIYYLYTDFESNWPDYGLGGWLTDSINPWVIDTTNPGNIWQIGRPHKSLFDSAYSVPNAIVTDTINFYPINNHSCFYYNIKKPEYQEDRCWSMLIIRILHKLQTDKGCDGGYVEISYDGGKTYINIVNDHYLNVNASTSFYTVNDTLTGGIPGISGLIDEWTYDGFSWVWPEENWQIIDSAIVRFCFISDSIDSGKSGWLIDDIDFRLYDLCGIGVDEITNNVQPVISPHPINDVSYLSFQNNKKESYTFEMYNLLGTKVKVENNIVTDQIIIHKSNLPKGMYVYKLYNKKGIYYSDKLLIN